MGWTGTFNTIRKNNGTIDRRATLERDFAGWKNGTKETRMLKSGMIGTTLYAAMETTSEEGREVWALVVLTSTNGDELRYKEMSEDMGPCSYNCPVGILNALTPTANKWANEWRQKCREEHEKKRAAAGRVPRGATQLHVTFLINTTASSAGDSVMLYKINGNWIYTDKTGNRWRLPASYLHNENILRVNGTEEPTEEPEKNQEQAATEEKQEDTTTEPVAHPAPKKCDLETFSEVFSNIYTDLYDHCGEPETDSKTREYCELFNEKAEENREILQRFAEYRRDIIASDREAAAFMLTLEKLGAPETIKEQENDNETSVFWTVTDASGETVAAGIAEDRNAATRQAATAAGLYITDTGNATRYTVGGYYTPTAQAVREYLEKTTDRQRRAS